MSNKLNESFEGFVISNQVLLSPGVWNEKHYSLEEIEKSIENTDWSDSSVTALIADHNDDDIENLPRSVHDWQGRVENIRFESPNLVGDLRLFDTNSIYKLRDGHANFGISVKVSGDNFNNNVCNFIYKNFSLVVNPACKDAYIKLSKQEKSGNTFYILNEIKNEGLAEVSNFEEIRKNKKMSVSEFYAIPKDPPSESKLPIFDAAHVRNALARFNQVKGVSEEEKKKAYRKIIAKAKSFGIHVSEKNSEFIQLKGGNKITKMVEKLEEAKAEEVKLEEEVEEEPKEEPKAEEPEVKPEEPKSEEKSEEPEVKEEPKEEVKEELSAEDELKVINNAIEILKAKIPKAVNELSEDSRFSELSARIEKLEQMVTEKLGEFTQKLSSLESPGTTEKLSESKKSSEVLEKLSVEAKNKFSLDENEVSNGTLNFASSLIEKHLK